MSDWGFDDQEAGEVASELHSGGFIEAEGWYHFAIKEIDFEYVFSGGTPLDGPCYKLNVLAPEASKDEMYYLKLDKPNYEKSEGIQKLCKARLAAMFLATNIWVPGQPLPSREVVESTVGRQLCIKMKKNNSGYLEPDYDRIYHVDDPKSNACPKNDAALNVLPPALRGDPKTKAANGSTAAPIANGNGNGNQVQQPAQQQQPAAAAKDWTAGL